MDGGRHLWITMVVSCQLCCNAIGCATDINNLRNPSSQTSAQPLLEPLVLQFGISGTLGFQ